MQENPLLQAALAYAARGWHVFPCAEPVQGDDTSGKYPITPNGKDDATTDTSQIVEWWTRNPNANIGIACEPSGLIVLDVDVGEGKNGAASLASIDHHLTPTLRQRSGGGGLHAVYSRGDASPRQLLGMLGPESGLDLIGKGYIIAAPSLHWSGNRYAWIDDRAIAPVPDFLCTVTRPTRDRNRDGGSGLGVAGSGSTRSPGDNQGGSGVVLGGAHSTREARIEACKLLAGSFPARGRHATFLALSGALAQLGWTVKEVEEFTSSVTQLLPGYTDAERRSAYYKRTSQAEDSVARVARGDSVEGWGTLASFIPQDAIDGAMRHLGVIDDGLDWVGQDSPTSAVTDLLGEASPDIAPVADKPFRLAEEIAGLEWPPVVSYPTPYERLNALLGGGISTQQLTVLLGPPGAGKSALFLDLVTSLEPQVPGIYCSSELQLNEIVARMVAPKFKTSWSSIVRGKGRHEDGRPITAHDQREALKGKRIAVIGQDEVYKAGDKIVQVLMAQARAMHAEYGVMPVIWIDYLQELARGEDPTKQRSRTTAIAVACRQVSQLLDCAVVAVCSVSRAGYGAAGAALKDSEDPSIYMSLAKESGDIDYAAAAIIFLDMASDVDGLGWRMGRACVGKSRHGMAGFVGLKFHGPTGSWAPCDQALEALSPANRQTAKIEKALDSMQARVLQKVSEFVTLKALKTRAEIKVLLGGQPGPVNVAMDSLIRDGKLVETVESTVNPLTKKLDMRKVLTLPSETVPLTPAAPTMSAAEYLKGIVPQ